jgi:Uma2 family endonuclease
MIDILESPDVRRRALPITVDTYHWMVSNGLVSQRAELIRGVIVEKMSKSSLHEFLTNELFALLMKVLGEGWCIRKEGPLSLGDSEPEPDLSIVRGKNADFLHHHPQSASLVIEVCVTSESLDREMLKIYAEAGIEECWLVLAKSSEIEAYSSPVGGQYQQSRRFGRNETLVSQAFPQVQVNLAEVFP